ncbi:hypothetical protein AO263_27000 [Pseudomonas sp. NZIPFR-PS5]|nr:hypothetical protein AO263_27000 [Pseudomonas sp. NZIPFR-PS5]
MFEFIYLAILIGMGGTALLDLWALLLKAVLGLPTPPWHLVGRWFAGMPKGQFAHRNGIGTSPPCYSSGACNGRMGRPSSRP